MISPRAVYRLSDTDYELVQALIRERSGLELPDARRHELDRAVDDALAASGTDSPEALCAYLSEDDSDTALDTFLSGLTVQESHFFRGRPQWDALSREVIPSLVASRRDTRRLRVWSAGCANGEEPYSLAILLERIIPGIADWDVLVLATDMSASALQTAEAGIYRRWSFREVPAEIKREYFVGRGGELEVIARVRDRVTLARLNLATDRYPSVLSGTNQMDLVLCRNVLIYFNSAVAAVVLRRLCDALAIGGWLVLGQAETGIVHDPRLARRRIGGALLYQKIGGSTSER